MQKNGKHFISAHKESIPLLRPFSKTNIRLITFVKTKCIEFYENLKNSLVTNARSQVDVRRNVLSA